MKRQVSDLTFTNESLGASGVWCWDTGGASEPGQEGRRQEEPALIQAKAGPHGEGATVSEKVSA